MMKRAVTAGIRGRFDAGDKGYGLYVGLLMGEDRMFPLADYTHALTTLLGSQCVDEHTQSG